MTFPGRDSRISEFYHWYTVFYDSLWIYSTQLFMVIALLYSTLARRELGGQGLHGNGIGRRRDFFFLRLLGLFTAQSMELREWIANTLQSVFSSSQATWDENPIGSWKLKLQHNGSVSSASSRPFTILGARLQIFGTS